MNHLKRDTWSLNHHSEARIVVPNLALLSLGAKKHHMVLTAPTRWFWGSSELKVSKTSSAYSTTSSARLQRVCYNVHKNQIKWQICIVETTVVEILFIDFRWTKKKYVYCSKITLPAQQDVVICWFPLPPLDDCDFVQSNDQEMIDTRKFGRMSYYLNTRCISGKPA